MGGGSRNLIHWISIFRNLYHSGPFQSSHSFYLAICTLSLRLLGILRPISSKPPGFCPQVERSTVTVGPQFWFQQFQVAGIMFQRRAVWLITIKRSFHLFLLPLSLLQSFLILWAVLLLFIHFEILLCPPFLSPPPHPRRGDLGHHRPVYTFLIFICCNHTR